MYLTGSVAWFDGFLQMVVIRQNLHQEVKLEGLGLQ